MATLIMTGQAAPRKAPAIPWPTLAFSPKLTVAIGCSLALHGIALLGIGTLRPTTANLPPAAESIMWITLEAPSNPAMEPAVAEPASAADRRAQPSSSSPSPAALRTTETSSAAGGASAPLAEPHAAVEPRLIPDQLTGAPPSVQTAPSPANRSLEDPFAEYRRRLWTELAAHAPAAAPGSGVATIVLGLDESGALRFVRLARSSGQPAFDRACLRAIRSATPFSRPPADIGAENLVFEVPIRARARPALVP